MLIVEIFLFKTCLDDNCHIGMSHNVLITFPRIIFCALVASLESIYFAAALIDNFRDFVAI